MHSRYVSRFPSRVLASVLGGAAFSLVAVTVLAGVASAHVEPDPAAVEAGDTTTIQFKIEHGCDASPTTKVEIKAPAGASDVTAVAKPGWTQTAAGDVVTYSNGSLDPDTPDTFGVTLKLPAAPGKVAFPVVQTCEKGSVDWIELTPPGGAEPEHPAPVVEVTEAAPTSDEVAGTHDDDAGSHDQGVTGPDSAVAVSNSTSDTGLDTIAGERVAKQSNDNKSLILGGIVAAVVVVAGGLGFTQLRKRESP